MSIPRALLASALLLISPVIALADIPATVSFTARLVDNGAPLSGAHNLVFALHDDMEAGNELWSERHDALQVSDGLAYAELGISTPLNTTVLSGAPVFLSITVDGTVMSPRVPIGSVPYAMRAGVAGSAQRVGNLTPEELLTGVMAGTGLGGVTNNGVVALDVNLDVVQARIFGTCAQGAAIKAIRADGSVSCETFSISGGTVTNLATGAGLTGGPVTTQGTISIATGGVTNQMLQNRAVTIVAGPGLTGGGLTPLGASTTLGIGTGALTGAMIANDTLGDALITDDITAGHLRTLGAAPACASGDAGLIYFDTTTSLAYLCDGTSLVALAAASDIAAETTRATAAEQALALDLSTHQDALASVGTVNNIANPVDWTQLKNVPDHAVAGYVPGPGLQLTGNTFAIGVDVVTGTMIADGTLMSWDLGSNAGITDAQVEDDVTAGRLENLATAPTCTFADAGRVYYDTTSNLAYLCDGTSLVAFAAASDVNAEQARATAAEAANTAALTAFQDLVKSTGNINDVNNPVDWTQLKNVPATAAGYVAGAGIDVSGTIISVPVGGITAAQVQDGTLNNNDLSPSAAIDYSKLNLGGAIVDADISAIAALDYTKLNLSGSIQETDLAPASVTDDKVAFGISYSKLSGAPSSFPPTGVASGDLTGFYPNPIIAPGVVSGSHVVDGALENVDISATANIDYAKLNLAGSIQNTDLSPASVTDDKVAFGISYSKLSGAPGSFPPAGPASGDLTGFYPSPSIAGGVITGFHVSDGTIADNDISLGASIDYSKLYLVNSIQSSDLMFGSVTDDQVASGISYSKLSGAPTSLPPDGAASGDLTGNYPAPIVATNAIDTGKILDGTIVDNDISGGAGISYGKLNLFNSIQGADLVNLTVTDAKLAPGISYGKLSGAPSSLPPSGPAFGDLTGSYPNPNIAGNAVTSAKIFDGTIANIDVAAGAGITYAKLNLNNSVVNSDIASGAGISYSKLNLNNSITNTDISSSAAIAYSKLNLTNSINTNDLVNGSVTDAKIATGISYSKIVGGPVATVTYNPNQVALMRWWQANGAGIQVPVGGNSYGATFDGQHVWVSSLSTGNIIKIRASDNAVIGTYAGGSQPYALTFDGAHIWAANNGGGTVTKIRASDGVTVGSYSLTGQHWAIAFDGAYVWVGTLSPASVSKMRVSDGQVMGTYSVGAMPVGIAFDGTNIWTTGNNAAAITVLSAADGSFVNSYSQSQNPYGIAFDGVHMWVTSQLADTITKRRASDGVVVGTYATGDQPLGVVFDGTNIWVTNNSGNSVTKLRASDGANLGTFPVGGTAYAITFDGANVWAVAVNSSTATKL